MSINTAYNGRKKKKGIKIHACVNYDGFPLTIQIFYGKDSDQHHFLELMQDIKIRTDGRPRTRPKEVLVDSACDDVKIRQYLRLRFRRIQSDIPINPRNTKTRKRGRPTGFDSKSYQKRGAVERFLVYLFFLMDNNGFALDSI